jgi:hypothetical protein
MLLKDHSMTTSSDTVSSYGLTNSWIDQRTSRARDDRAACMPAGPIRKLIATCMGPLLIALATLLSFTAAAPTAAAQAVEPPSLKPTYRTITGASNFRQNYDYWKNRFRVFDWSNDGCTGAGITGYGDDFYWPCVQHDFAYRNNRRVGVHNEATRKRVDDVLRRNTRAICSRRPNGLDKHNCYGASDTIYNAVRTFGGAFW